MSFMDNHDRNLINLLKSPRFLDNSGKCTWVYAAHSKKLSGEKRHHEILINVLLTMLIVKELKITYDFTNCKRSVVEMPKASLQARELLLRSYGVQKQHEKSI